MCVVIGLNKHCTCLTYHIVKNQPYALCGKANILLCTTVINKLVYNIKSCEYVSNKHTQAKAQDKNCGCSPCSGVYHDIAGARPTQSGVSPNIPASPPSSVSTCREMDGWIGGVVVPIVLLQYHVTYQHK